MNYQNALENLEDACEEVTFYFRVMVQSFEDAVQITQNNGKHVGLF